MSLFSKKKNRCVDASQSALRQVTVVHGRGAIFVFNRCSTKRVTDHQTGENEAKHQSSRKPSNLKKKRKIHTKQNDKENATRICKCIFTIECFAITKSLCSIRGGDRGFKQPRRLRQIKRHLRINIWALVDYFSIIAFC